MFSDTTGQNPEPVASTSDPHNLCA